MPDDSKSPDEKKKNNKDSQLIIRIQRQQRDDFVALCDRLNSSAASEIRQFIRGFIQDHSDSDPESEHQ